MIATDSHCHHKALKKVCISVPNLQEFLVLSAFPWRLSRRGPWHRAVARDWAGRAQISCKITFLLYACIKMCWSLHCVWARTWLFNRTPPKSEHLTSRATAQQLLPGQMELLAGACSEGMEKQLTVCHSLQASPTHTGLSLLRWNCSLSSWEWNLTGCLSGRNCTEWHVSFCVSATRWPRSCGDGVPSPVLWPCCSKSKISTSASYLPALSSHTPCCIGAPLQGGFSAALGHDSSCSVTEVFV